MDDLSDFIERGTRESEITGRVGAGDEPGENFSVRVLTLTLIVIRLSINWLYP